jgi:hypothetical protein
MNATDLRAAEANDKLTIALVSAAARGIRPRCGDSYLWLSELEHERQQAARLCANCVVIAECDEVGKHQRFGTWAGIDRSSR